MRDSFAALQNIESVAVELRKSEPFCSVVTFKDNRVTQYYVEVQHRRLQSIGEKKYAYQFAINEINAEIASL